MTDNNCSPDTEPLSEADVLASIGGWRIGCEIEQENRYIVSKCDLAGYLAIRKHYAPVTPEGDPAWQLTDIGLRRLATIGTSEQFCDAINMRDWYRANASKPASPQTPVLREALEDWFNRLDFDRSNETTRHAEHAELETILAAPPPVLPPSGGEGTWKQSDEAIRNLIAKEIWRYQEYIDAYGPFNEVSVDSGDMKALAKQMAIDEADGIRKVILSSLVVRARIAALSASVAGEADHCKKCGCELNGEAALVGDEVLCHPCADAAPSPAPDPATVEACAKVVDRWISDITKAGDQFDKGGDIYAHANVLQGVASAIRALASPAPRNAEHVALQDRVCE